MKRRLRWLWFDFWYVITNYVIANIPCWHLRKWYYQLCGMKIGKDARIMMKCTILDPGNICIGDGTVINEYCYIDGRGGLCIGKSNNISVYSIILTASHDRRSNRFAFKKEPVIIGDYVWMGARAIILGDSIVKNKAIIAASSVFKGESKEDTIYIGIPAEERSKRGLEGEYDQQYRRFFR